MDQNVWDDYKDVNGNAAYAIGGPTLELFKNSFNATVGNNKSSKKIEVTSADGVGYYYTSVSGSFSEDDNKGIYFQPTEPFLLASPEHFTTIKNEYKLRPVVIIPKTKFNVYRFISD